MQHMYASEILEQFRAGKKEFDNIRTQFCDLEGIDLSGLVIKNSKLDYTSFRHSTLKNVKLINCEMFFFSFYGSKSENLVIDKCKIDTVRMDSMQVKNMKISNTELSYCTMFDTNLGEIKMQNVTEFRVIKNILELSEEEAMEILEHVGEKFENLPVEVRIRLREVMKRALGEVGKDPSLVDSSNHETGDNAYGKGASGTSLSNLYNVFSAISDEVMKYGNSEAYKTNSTSYKDKKKY